jgi:hypothetical protein
VGSPALAGARPRTQRTGADSIRVTAWGRPTSERRICKVHVVGRRGERDHVAVRRQAARRK